MNRTYITISTAFGFVQTMFVAIFLAIQQAGPKLVGGLSESTIVAIAVALFGAIPPTLMAYAALRQGKRVGAQTVAVAATTDHLVTKTAEIHVLTNDNLSRITARLEVANAKIAGLERLVSLLIDKNRGSQVTDGLPERTMAKGDHV